MKIINIINRTIGIALSSLYERIDDIVWGLIGEKRFIKEVTNLGFTDIMPILTEDWHLTARYFKANRLKKLYFIKSAHYHLVENEVIINKMIAKADPSYVFPLIDYVIDRHGGSFFVTEFISKHKSLYSNGSLNSEVFDNLKLRLNDVVGLLCSLNIVHRDLNPKNIFISDDGSDVKIIDFAMSAHPFAHNYPLLPISPIVLASLGKNYKPALFEWSDQYSIEAIIKELERKKRA